MLTAIETTGTINANHELVLDEDLPSNAPNGDSKKRRRAGSAEGLIKMSDDFDAPLEDFEEYQ